MKSISKVKRILVPSGRDYERCMAAFQENYTIPVPDFQGRKLEAKIDGRVFIKVKGKDVPKLVASGFADIGLTGADVCEDRISRDMNVSFKPIGEPMCSFDLLLPKTREKELISRLKDKAKPPVRIATSFPMLLNNCVQTAERQGRVLNVTVDSFTPSGSVEVMPLLGVSEAVADLYESGETASANSLVHQKLRDIYPAVVWRDQGQTSEEGIESIDETLANRRAQVSDTEANSYTLARLRDRNLAVKKFGEEAAEFQQAANSEDKKAQTNELADVLYAGLVLSTGVRLTDVIAELMRRNQK